MSRIWRITGRFVGFLWMALLGGTIWGVIVGPNPFPGAAILMVLTGAALTWGALIALRPVASIKPVLRWLFPYDTWLGESTDLHQGTNVVQEEAVREYGGEWVERERQREADWAAGAEEMARRAREREQRGRRQ